jgi:thioesterase domain-containing protein/acyl carrier protein
MKPSSSSSKASTGTTARWAGKSADALSAEVNAMVVDIVVGLLGCTPEELNADEPLMEAGLDSLAATQLVRELAISFELSLSPTLLFDYPTMNVLSLHLCEKLSIGQSESFSFSLKSTLQSAMVWHTPITGASKIFGNIVSLQSGQIDIDPIVFVYGNQGLVVGKEMIGTFPKSQPIFSLQAPDLLSQTNFVDLEERALLHVDELCEHFSGRRIHLIGFSLGGFLAAIMASDKHRYRFNCTLTLIDPVPLTEMNLPSSTDLIEIRRIWMNMIHPDLGSIYTGREVTDVWDDDMALLKALEYDEKLTNAVRKYLNSILSIAENFMATLANIKTSMPCYNNDCGIFILEDGISFFNSIIPSVDNSDGAYGWSRFLRNSRIYYARGGHFDFFKSAENKNRLLEHMTDTISYANSSVR